MSIDPPEYEVSKGRPPKPESEKRNTILKVCVTDEEAETIKQLSSAVGKSTSEYLRELGLGQYIDPKVNHRDAVKIKALLEQVIYQHKMYGSNLNQALKKLNQMTQKEFGHNAPEFDFLYGSLSRIETRTDRLIEELEKL